MSTFRRPTRREVLATGAAAIVTSLLPRQHATAAEAASGGVPTGPGSVLGAPICRRVSRTRSRAATSTRMACAFTPSSEARAVHSCWSMAGRRPGTNGGW